MGRQLPRTAAGDFGISDLTARALNGNLGVAAVPITFQVISGDGVLRTKVPLGSDYVYGQTLMLTTDNDGFTTGLRFRAGSAGGANRIVVSASGFDPDTFTVTGTRLSDCAGVLPLSLGDSLNTTLVSTDCPDFFRSGFGWYTKPYRITLVAPAMVQLSMRSSGNGPALTAMTPLHYAAHSIGTSQAGFIIVLPAGSFYLGASSNEASKTMAFSIAATPWPAASAIRRGYFLTKGIDYTSTLDGARFETSPPYRGTGGRIFLPAGVAVTVTVQSADFDPYVTIRDVERSNTTSQEYVVIASDDNGGGGTTARLVFTPSRSGVYEIWLGNAKSTDPTGTYRLIIQ